jgi:hypothetical protein
LLPRLQEIKQKEKKDRRLNDSDNDYYSKNSRDNNRGSLNNSRGDNDAGQEKNKSQEKGKRWEQLYELVMNLTEE